MEHTYCRLLAVLLCSPLRVLQVLSVVHLLTLTNERYAGTFKSLSNFWRNGFSMIVKPQRIDWGEQVVLITGGVSMSSSNSPGDAALRMYIGASGIGSLLARTLAVRNVTVVVLDINPIETENCNFSSSVSHACVDICR